MKKRMRASTSSTLCWGAGSRFCKSVAGVLSLSISLLQSCFLLDHCQRAQLSGRPVRPAQM
jgi:hypothetical protein